MKNTFNIIPKQNLILETLSQSITPKAYLELKHQEFQHKSFNRNFNLIADLRQFNQVENIPLFQNIIDILMENKGKVSRKKSAVVLKNNKVSKHISFSKNSKTEVKIFTSIEDAEKWTKK